MPSRLLAHSQRSAGQGCEGAVLTIVDDGEGCHDLEVYTSLGHDDDHELPGGRARALHFLPILCTRRHSAPLCAT